ncbi:hypothetical protein J2W91_004575 [Paenibacillus amylolyticus]|uniref:SLH domain-containing protein n=1 Tax=Paenibacillus amylolyticus TaxID=1451 RepID=A0AAP5H4B4_PAEAM|nr:S-layer homology domain-containing protein [Paenibacillus amylolyticus]MDR6726069.1 hypothetical protein [Paenibacillus amylolyticus]
MKKWGSLFLTGALLFSSMATAVQAAPATNVLIDNETSSSFAQHSFQDVNGNWAQEVIKKWADRGIVQGNEQNMFLPQGKVTRAEWVAMINRIFQYEQVGNYTFTDVSLSSWYAQDVAKGVQAGYIQGYTDGSFNPVGTLTRQEAALTISRILNLQSNGEASFTDHMDIQDWSKEAVSAAADKKIIIGYSNGSFLPNKAITRAEAVQILDRAFSTYGSWYGQEGTYGSEESREEISGNVVIGASGVTLQNMDITGDLIISKAVGDGDVFLKNVTVQGKTYVYGGGENSVHLEDSVLLTVIVNKQDGTVRLVATGKTEVHEMTIQTSSNIETNENAKIDKLTLSEALPEKSRVYLKGNFETVDVVAKSINIQIPSGTVNQLNLADSAENTAIEISQEAKVITAILNSAVKLLGTGTIEQATVNAMGVTMEKAPNKLNLGSGMPADTSVQIDGVSKPVTSFIAPVTTVPAANGGSSSGSSGTGGGTNPSNPYPGTGGSTNPGDPGSSNGGVTPPITPLPGREYGSYDGGSYYFVGVESDAITVTDAVYIYSPRSGYAYVSKSSINENDPVLLEEAINQKTAYRVKIEANTRTALPVGEIASEFSSYYKVFVVDNENRASYIKNIMVLDGLGKELKSQGMILSSGGWLSNQESYLVYFNTLIKAVDPNTLRNSIEISTGTQQPNYRPLNEGDQVEIVNNGIVITPKQNYGKSTYIRVNADAVETLDGLFRNKLYTSTQYKSFTRPEFIEYPDKWEITVPVGTVIKFKANYGGDTFYFVYKDTFGTSSDYDKEVTDGHGYKLEIPEDGAGMTFEFDTKDLQPGEYKIDGFGAMPLDVNLTAN